MKAKVDTILTLEEQLASFQDTDPVYAHLYTTWQTAKEDLAKILRNISLVFPHYSLHDASHAETIVHRVEAVLGEERIAQLHPTELWLFLMSAYTHDLGMLVRDEELHDVWQSNKFKEYLELLINEDKYSDLQEYAKVVLTYNPIKIIGKKLKEDWPVNVKWAVNVLSADYFRRYHPERSEEIICHPEIANKFFSFDFSFHHFIHERFILLLGKIATLHGKEFKDIILDLNYCCQGMGQADDIVYPRRIAAMLRLGDLLDMDNGRFDTNAMPLLGKVPDTTMSHQKKHAALTHFLVNPQRIEAAFDCPDEDSYEAASQWMTWLKNETENLSLHWNDIVSEKFGSAPNLKSVDIKLNGKRLKGNVLRHFDFNNDTVFELMEGSNIYKNRFSCLRELIQNAEDASKLQLWEDIQKGNIHLKKGKADNLKNLTPFDISAEELKKYTVQVIFKYDRENKYCCVEVKDQGIGISDAQLEQMGKVADSWHIHHKKAYQNMPAWLNPTGAFGLGLQSVFQITDELRCITLPAREPAKEIVFRSRRRGGRISSRDLEYKVQRHEGTQFSFIIKDIAFRSSGLSYNLGGMYDNLINSLDPFAYLSEEETIIEHLYYLMDSVYHDVHDDIIPVIVSAYNGDILINRFVLSKSISNINFSIRQEDLLLSINWRQAEIIAYNPKNSITYDLFMNGDGFHLPEFSFKGMNVKCEGWQTSFPRPYGERIAGTINIDGYSTREYLTLSREKIRREKSRTLIIQLRNDIVTIFSQIFSVLVQLDENDYRIISQDVWLTLAGFSEFIEEQIPVIEKDAFQEKIKNARQIILKYLQGDCITYEISEAENQKLKIDEKENNNSIKKFFQQLWKDQTIWIISADEGLPFQNDKGRENIELEHIISAQSNYQSFKGITVYSYSQIKNFLNMGGFNVSKVYGAKGRVGRLYQCKKALFNVFSVPEISPVVQDDLNKLTLKRPRTIIAASERYRNIAVQKLPDIFWYAHYSLNMWKVGNSPDLISPFSSQDIFNIQNHIITTAKQYWAMVNERQDFLSLIEFVKKNNIKKSITNQEIRYTYKLWIEDIFELLNQ